MVAFCWKLLEINKFLYFDDAHNAWKTVFQLENGQFWSDFHEIKTKSLNLICCTFLDPKVLDLKFSLHPNSQWPETFTITRNSYNAWNSKPTSTHQNYTMLSMTLNEDLMSSRTTQWRSMTSITADWRSMTTQWRSMMIKMIRNYYNA